MMRYGYGFPYGYGYAPGLMVPGFMVPIQRWDHSSLQKNLLRIAEIESEFDQVHDSELRKALDNAKTKLHKDGYLDVMKNAVANNQDITDWQNDAFVKAYREFLLVTEPIFNKAGILFPPRRH